MERPDRKEGGSSWLRRLRLSSRALTFGAGRPPPVGPVRSVGPSSPPSLGSSAERKDTHVGATKTPATDSSEPAFSDLASGTEAECEPGSVRRRLEARVWLATRAARTLKPKVKPGGKKAS